MFDNFCRLKVKGKCFQDETNFKFFEKNHHRFCLIYGKNGSGKSTISQVFNAIKSDKQYFEIVKILDSNEQEIQITNEQKDQIFVFNEEYINDRVKIKDDGLDTIILLGDAVDLEEKFKKIDKIDKKLQIRKTDYTNELEKYTKENSTDNPEIYKNNIEQKLKENFANREKDILRRPNRILQGKDINFANNIMENFETNLNKDEIQNEFDKKLEEYKKIQSDLNFENEIGQIKFDNIEQLLSHKVKQVEFGEYEEKIKQAINDGDSKITKIIMDSDKDICPYCFQKLTNEYKKGILSILENIFNQEIQNHQDELEKAKPQDLFFSLNLLPDMQKLDENLFNKIDLQIKDYQKDILSKIDEKIKNPFISLNLDEGFKAKANELNKNLNELEQKRQEFQAQKQRANEIKIELEKLNKELAYCEIKDDYKYYEEKHKNKENFEKKIRHNNDRLSYIESKKSQLNSQREQINIAQDRINQYLQYIFFKKDRLELGVPNQHKQYKLKSNGNSVKAQDISTGERNAIALSYFFTEIFSGENEAGFYKKPKFIVIDDPISSFDFENKVGVMSFLNYQIQNIINGCKNSKIIVLTHDLMSMFDLQKIGKTISSKDVKFSQFELKNNVLEKFGENYNYSEYKTLLNKIYNYAKNSQQSHSSTNIGNDMRKLLEAFGTFNYQCGIEKIATDEIITSRLSHTQKTYFSNLMYRLVLHGESHMEDKTKILNFTSYISETEKQKTAKDILSLLYLLHDTHLKKYLHKEQIESIEEWVKSCNIY